MQTNIYLYTLIIIILYIILHILNLRYNYNHLKVNLSTFREWNVSEVDVFVSGGLTVIVGSLHISNETKTWKYLFHSWWRMWKLVSIADSLRHKSGDGDWILSITHSRCIAETSSHGCIKNVSMRMHWLWRCYVRTRRLILMTVWMTVSWKEPELSMFKVSFISILSLGFHLGLHFWI